MTLAPQNYKYKPFMDENVHPYCEKKFISSQSVVKLYLQKLINLTQLGSSTLNKTLFNILPKFKLGKNFNLEPLKNYLEFDLIFVC